MRNPWYSLSMLLFFVLVCLAVGQLGAFFTTEETFAWYHTLAKPSWTPPDYLFPVVWTLLYVLMAIAGWLVWRARKPGYRNALVFWTVQLILNAMWTPLFFGQQAILYGLVVIDLLWLMLIITTIIFFKHSKLATFFMLIYLAWVTYAGVLNFMLWQMNH